MAERKVLNKYYPPDFDPSKIPRLRLGKNRQIKVRLVAPFAMRCNTCGQFIGKGTKFNARKETTDETFHSIPIYRFYIRCQKCAAEITYKTDPENANYVAEKGAERNFEPWREEKALNEQLDREKEEEEEENPIKALENRTEQSRREMEVMDELDEIRLQNAKLEGNLGASVVKNLRKEEEEALKRQEEEDDRLAKMVFAGGKRIKRAREEDALERELAIKQSVCKTAAAAAVAGKSTNSMISRALQGVVKKKKASGSQQPALSMLAAYGSDDDQDSSD
ncbi:Pre-mRNA-splicing factor cwf16 [Coemansia sp. RSA 990]|nr:Pre-mRNA-splicing factor cwf16 [Coemansia sp. RSA 1086]KAJ1749941.1 Pre-mRNA-splicing factor cwf16 [Coemansia sp. RSA 1821]KAJ1871299.1 Pre-mRNA-splicing factor cwf16 [Coemansia sp. RSA 990]